MLGEEHANVEFLDDATVVIVIARRASLTDVFKHFFSRLHDVFDSFLWLLPSGFRLSDRAIATLTNIFL